MAVFVMADIHGEYDMFIKMLDQIGLKEEDTLYILGDVLDRGPHPIQLLLRLVEMPNVICMLGNHELMAVKCLPFLIQEITNLSIDRLDTEMLDDILTWQCNGSRTTIEEFRALSREMQESVVDYITDFCVYEKLNVNGREYLLVHGGLGNYNPEKEMEDYTLDELVWNRAEYGRKYYEDVVLVTGHTPTQTIKGHSNPGFIFRGNNHLAIDCGCSYEGGRLAAVCLDTGEEFYVERGQ